MRNELDWYSKNYSRYFTFTPSAQINIDRMIKGMAPFCHQGLVEQKKQKKIVVTHSPGDKSDLEQLIFTLQLMTLHQEGFEVFLKSKDKPIPFNTIPIIHRNLSLLREMSGESKNESFYAQALNCSGDEIYLLDESKIAPMIKDGAEQWAHYSLKDGALSLKTSPLKIDGFCRLIEKNAADIKTLSLGYCPYLIKSCEAQTSINCENFPQLEELEIDLTAMRSCYKPDTQLILQIIEKSPHLKTFKLKLPKMTRDELQLFESVVSNILEIESIENIQLNIAQNYPENLRLPIKNPTSLVANLKVFNINGGVVAPDLLGKIYANGKLTSLRGDGFRFEGDIASYRLSNLDELDLSYSSITAKGLSELLASATNLKKLNLYNCQSINGEIDGIADLSKLEELNLPDSSITAKGLSALLANATKLKKLVLTRCKFITGEIEFIADLSKLEELNLRDSSITAKGLSALLASATNLKKLNLSCCTSIAGAIDGIVDLSKLEELDLSYSSITAKGLSALLASATNLKKLTLFSCQSINGEIEGIVDLSKLEELNLSGSTITIEGLSALLASATNLKKLDLSCCASIGRAVEGIADLLKLEVLSLDGSIITVEGLSALLASATNLKKLELYDCQSITGEIEGIADLSKLEELNLPNSSITAKGLSALLAKATNVKILRLTYCKSIAGEIEVIADLSKLEELNLSGSTITVEGLSALLAKATNLKILRLSGCKSITGEIDGIADLSKLEELDLRDSSITAEGLKNIRSRAPNLKITYEQSQRHNFDGPGQVRTPEGVTKEQTTAPHPQAGGGTRPHPQNLPCDADTKPEPRDFQVNKEFKNSAGDVSATEVRHDCFEILTFQDNASCPFLLSSLQKDTAHVSVVEPTISTIPHPNPTSETEYLGRFKLKLSKQWQPLPSVAPDETLQSYFVNNTAKVEIGYSNEKNFYYIRLRKEEEKSSVDAVVEVSLKANPEQALTLPSDVQALIAEIKGYQKKALDSAACSTGQSYIDAITTQKVGACRHRAIAFKHLMSTKHPGMLVRIVTNDCHAFVELMNEGKWIQVDLGGYPAKLNYGEDIFKENLSPKPDAPGVKVSDALSYFNSNPKAKVKALHLLSNEAKKILIETNDVFAARLQLQQISRATGKSFYYIDTPDELKCLGPLIQRNPDMKGTIKDGPGGALYDYLTKTAQPTLILNLSRFKTSDFVQYNSLFDEQPRLEGLDILENCKIIGLTDTAIAQDASITSRFDQQYHIECDPLPKLTNSDTEEGAVIECCGGLNWESRLIGTWILNGTQLTYKKGLLWEAIEKGHTPLVLNNAPLEDPNFVRLMHDMQFHNALYHQGEKLIGAQGLCVAYTNKHLVSDYKEHLKPSETQNSLLILNPDSLDTFIGRYDYQKETQSIQLKKGFIEEAEGNSINVYLAAKLSLEQWRLLVLCCQQHDTRLNLTLAPNVTMPDELQLNGEIPCTLFPEVAHAQCMTHQPPSSPDALHVDISELTPDDLLPGLKRLDKTATEFKFEAKLGFLKEQLDAGKTIVLSGDWQNAKSLTHALHSFVFNRMQNAQSMGKLILVQGEHQPFPFMTATASEPKPVEKVEPALKIEFSDRAQAVNASLAKHPVLIMTGPTGVGKTHFMNEYYPNAHFGEGAIKNWIEDKKAQPILFIDEANMSYQQWSMFEGLFQNPPGIFYQGAHHRLTENHRVVFAANPLSYGGERQLPSLFRNHPVELEFKPLSAQELLKTLEISDATQTAILPMVEFIFRIQSDKVLLTPREILMVKQLANAHEGKEDFTKNIAYSIFKTHVPKEYQQEFSQFSPQTPTHVQLQHLTSFVVNDTNQPAVDALSHHLSIRKTRTGGLGGVIIEGEPGVGKSQLVTQLLTEEHSMAEEEDFIRVPISLSYDKKQALLLQAFHQGQIVIIDEINASPMMERLLNALLEGHDLDNKAAVKPGFMIIGTQNPPSYCGRVQTTLPLKHRLQTVELNEYKPKEMQDILEKKGLSKEQAEKLISDYQKHQQKCNLCFRDLLKMARSIFDVESKKETAMRIKLSDITIFCKTQEKPAVELSPSSSVKPASS